jgi:hypothetical protein
MRSVSILSTLLMLLCRPALGQEVRGIQLPAQSPQPFASTLHERQALLDEQSAAPGVGPVLSSTQAPLAGTELIQDGGFESGGSSSSGFSTVSSAWSWYATGSGAMSSPRYTNTSTGAAHSGLYCVYFNFGPSHDQLYQSLSIPSNSTATLSFWLKIGNSSSNAADVFGVNFTDLSGQPTGTFVKNYHASDAVGYSYVHYSYDVSMFAGQTVYLLFWTNEVGQTIFMLDDVSLVVSTSSGSCTPDANTLCLFGSRFKVTAQYQSYGSSTYSTATATGFSDNTGFFTTVTPGNVDVVVKLVNFCSLNNSWSAYIGGTTDLGVRVSILDTNTNNTYTASNPLGNPWSLIRQTAFQCP